MHFSHLHFEQQIQEQRQQERQQPVANTTATIAAGGPQQHATISIVFGSASKTTDAFQQNPTQASVGPTAVWTNDDSQPRTVTSGQTPPPTPNCGFESSIWLPLQDLSTLSQMQASAPTFSYYIQTWLDQSA